MGGGKKEQNQVPNQRTFPKLADELPPCWPSFEGEFHHSLHPTSVYLHKELNQLPGRNFWATVRHLVEFADQDAELPYFLLEFFFVDHATPSLSALEQERGPGKTMPHLSSLDPQA